jgi:hypothetical protein
MITARMPALLAALVLLLAGRPANAQLISPGKLAAAHSQLEGISSCTKCHDLGKKGASNAKCLSCHESLRTRITSKAGLHATYTGKTCGSCHKDHFGTAFAMVNLDTAAFDHTTVGFELKLAHKTASCRACHTEALVSDPSVRAYATEHKSLGRTYMGLATGCLDCHRTDNAHGEQFGTSECTQCHTEASWKKAPLFRHDSAKYVLTGRHRTAACEKCHRPTTLPGADKPVRRYVGVTASGCTSCHVDRHQGRMSQNCASCHSTDGWAKLLDRNRFEAGFDHGRTRFLLRGAHAQARCAACHDPATRPSGTVRLSFPRGVADATYPAPRATGCLSCHVDVHDSTFVGTAGGATCQNCHGESSWLPTSYDLARHNRETFVLDGAHVATPCAACHPPAKPAGPPKFKLGARDCQSCHRARDPHAGQFPQRACAECHVTATFRIAAFDHSRTRFSLDGAHQNVSCAKCHGRTALADGTAFTRYRPLETSCKSCHGVAIPRRS